MVVLVRRTPRIEEPLLHGNDRWVGLREPNHAAVGFPRFCSANRFDGRRRCNGGFVRVHIYELGIHCFAGGDDRGRFVPIVGEGRYAEDNTYRRGSDERRT